ncbi:MAG: cysteine desulfurase [Chloroflexota bacterium]|nr:cysteine desulfurase [Chloroflexota bacterium]
MERRRVYFDHTATTALAPGVFEAIAPYFTERWLSPGALYRDARALKRDVDGARRRIAECLAAGPNDLVLTSSGTESINLAVRGVAQASQHRGRHLVTSLVEHRAVLDCCQQLEKQGWRVTYLPVDGTGRVDLEALAAALDDETVLVSVMLANNEVGTIEPLAEVVRIVKAHSPAIPVQTDAVAAAGYLPLDVGALGVDLLSLSAHKVGGPLGAGLLWVRRGVLLQAQQLGGDQERGRRAGPENVPAIMGMAHAFEQALPASTDRSAQVKILSQQLVDGVLERVPGSVLTGHPVERLPHVASFCFERVDGEALLQQLDVQGISAASGSACTSATLEPSHVLKAMGLPPLLAEGNLRLSLGPENTADDVAYVLDVLPKLIDRARALRR